MLTRIGCSKKAGTIPVFLLRSAAHAHGLRPYGDIFFYGRSDQDGKPFPPCYKISNVKPTPFNPESDLPPTPFSKDHRELALRLKQAGLAWKPHVGCFVWDREGAIPVESPFPGRGYFILNLGDFLRLLGTAKRVRERLVWLPMWHQARLAADKLGVDEKALLDIRAGEKMPQPGEELLRLYGILLATLEKS